jgi:hypothetical protein
VIILDEHLGVVDVYEPLRAKMRGAVIYIQDLRPGTTVKDEAVPALLLDQSRPVFVTINEGDFWLKVRAHQRYCVICFALSAPRQKEIPGLLLRFWRHPEFRTYSRRMGKVIRVSSTEIQWYDWLDPLPRRLQWI